MIYDAKNGDVSIGNTKMDYITFGRGEENLILIPGLGDGLKTVKGTAAMMAIMFRKYSKRYKVYVFSRTREIAEDYTIKDMAKDQKEAMEKLNISKSNFVGISQGGMIAQHMALDYPELVEKLVLCVTAARPNETMRDVLNVWSTMAKANDYRSLFIDMIEKSYTEKYKKRYRLLYPILTRVGKPKDFNRFLIQAKAITHHDIYGELEKIKCPTFVIGAELDEIIGKESSEEIAEKIKNSKLLIYEGLGHGAYEEAKDFSQQVLAFLNPQS